MFGALVLFGTAKIVESLGTIWNIWSPEKNELALAADAEKGESSRNLTAMAWRRLFWARVYNKRSELGADDGELDYAWQQYIESAAEWSSQIMISLQLLDHFYPGTGKRKELESKIQPEWAKLNNALRDLRYASAATNEQERQEQGLQERERLHSRITSVSDQLNYLLSLLSG